jgi:hypothetical protein
MILVFAIVDTFVGPGNLALNIVIFGGTFAIAIAYVAHLSWANPMSDLRRWLWAIALILFAPIAIPLYWWLYLAPERLRMPARPVAPAFTQVPVLGAGYDEIGLIGMPWEDFAGRFGVRFIDGRAAVELPAGDRFGLEHHGDEPYPGVFLLGRLDQDMPAQRRAFASAVGLREDAFRYVRDEDAWRDPRTGEVVV